jgi:energy-coupling factor transporter ATP-binding protein EcfA2
VVGVVFVTDMVIRDEGHVLVLGASGTGKTTLVKQELQSASEALGRIKNRVLVLDRIGNYKGFTEHHGPFPLNPLEFIRPEDFIDVVSQAVISTYGNIQTPWSPAQEKIVEDCLEGTAPRGRGRRNSGRGGEGEEVEEEGGEPARSIPEVIQCIRTSHYSERDDEMARKAVERRIKLFNNLMWARRTHGLLRAWLEGRLDGSLAIDLSRVPLPEANAYVYALLAILARSHAIKGPMIVVIDEAQYYAKASLYGGLSLLEEALRVSRNFGIYFIAMTQSPEGLPRGLLDIFKIYVVFNIMNRKSVSDVLGFQIPDSTFKMPFTAYLKVLLTSEDAYGEFGGKQLAESGFFSANISVNPRALEKLPNADIICPDLNPAVPVVEGRQVRDYIARNIKCLLDAEAGVEA